ncbi:MAG TPA: hypothetical protein PLA94_13095, partial [Myxococcota bacterium]|nr:hypothetical protein [Myxococcota bacterium]
MLWLSAAVAAPTFVADEPHLRELGTAAWEAAVRCTGREGRSYPTVLVDVGPVRGGFAGTAHRDGEGVGWVLYGDGRPPEEFRWEGEGMYMIRLIAEDPTLLAHEVAH